MNILFASSEVTPFAKTGGLADVCGTLPKEVQRLGHSVVVFLPAYRGVKSARLPLELVDWPLEIPIGGKLVSGSVWKSHLPDSDVPVYLIDQPGYFDRDSLYGDASGDYRDNCERFVFFNRAILDVIPHLDEPIDLLHCNDWQTGLLPAYLATNYAGDALYSPIATLFTIHNLAYQGSFWHWDMLLTGIDWKYFNWRQMEFHGRLNLMKTGLAFADRLSTVSPRYAKEIQQPPLGCGLQDVLADRADVLSGILNGVDYTTWGPETDTHIAQNYSIDNWREGKAACKAALQNAMGLSQRADVPLLGLVGRLASQRGWDLVIDSMRQSLALDDAQWVVLGAGEPQYTRSLTQMTLASPNRVAARFEFSESTAHQIEAGADMFVMPSQYEPCGLNQLYSLKYGTIPIVHETGGLSDTIVDEHEPERGTPTGFEFTNFDVATLSATLERACDVYRHDPDRWADLVQAAMQQDWSWSKSARQYVQLYERTVKQHRSRQS